jgi:tetratricopeptide (TPR) repeat protein
VLSQGFPNAVWAQAANIARRPPVGHTAQFFLDQGSKQLEQKRFAIAVRTLSAAIRRDPRLAEAYRLRGQALDQMGVPHRAIQDFTKYIELKPADSKGYVLRGDAHNFNLEHEPALADYNHAIKLHPSSVPAHLGKGLAYAGLEKYDEAIKEYQWVVKSSPDHTEALANMGVACMLAGRSMEAMNYFERALKQEKDPQWRDQMEKWIAKLLQDPNVGNSSAVPGRSTPGKSGKPLW